MCLNDLIKDSNGSKNHVTDSWVQLTSLVKYLWQIKIDIRKCKEMMWITLTYSMVQVQSICNLMYAIHTIITFFLHLLSHLNTCTLFITLKKMMICFTIALFGSGL